jgi:hypothetical protein
MIAFKKVKAAAAARGSAAAAVPVAPATAAAVASAVHDCSTQFAAEHILRSKKNRLAEVRLFQV